MNGIRERESTTAPAALRVALVVALAALGIGALAFVPLPSAIDWDETFRPAVLTWLAGGNPYAPGPHPLYNPPWVLLPLLPFALLPQAMGRAALLMASLTAFAMAAKRFGASPLTMIMFVVSVPAFSSVANLGNIEWLIALGLILPRPVGMLLLALKPQASAAVMVWYAVESWRAGGIRGLVKLLSPLVILAGLSFVMFGPWPLRTASYLQFKGADMDYSFFPYTVPVGLVLLIQSIRGRDVRYALPASMCFAPVTLSSTWTIAFLPLVGVPIEMAAAWISLWVIALTNGRPI